MLALRTVSLTLQPYPSLQSQTNLDSYLILSINNAKHFSSAVNPINNTYHWDLHELNIKIAQEPSAEIQLTLMHYDSCKQIGSYTVQMKESRTSCKNYVFQHVISEQKGSVKIQVIAELENKSQGESRQKARDYVRNSKKTNTTNYEEPTPISILQKVHSLKSIVGHQRDILNLTKSQSPKHIAELAYLRSFRQNLEKKLFNSIELNSGKRKYVI